MAAWQVKVVQGSHPDKALPQGFTFMEELKTTQACKQRTAPFQYNSMYSYSYLPEG